MRIGNLSRGPVSWDIGRHIARRPKSPDDHATDDCFVRALDAALILSLLLPFFLV